MKSYGQIGSASYNYTTINSGSRCHDMLRIAIFIFLTFSISCGSTVFAAQQHLSSYAGQQNRKIKSLSADDIQQLKRGQGWGLAKAAELNGMPGPSHLLQMKDEISLTAEQERKIRALFHDMKSKAIPLGNKLIELEKNLNDSFSNKSITSEDLDQKLTAISKVRKELRYVHLVTHLMTPNILTPQQINEYNLIRGYGSGNPCENIPEGHSVEMWKKHNGCE